MVLFLFVTWEQRKLGDVGKAQSGIGFPDREQGGKEGVPFYKVSDMNNYGNEHEMHSANNYVTEEQCRRNGWTPITEISVVFAKVGAAIMLNRKRLVRFSFLLDNNTMAYRFGSGWDINFGKTLFERVDLTELVQIGALPSYNATDVESVEISMPDKPEQYQIGEFFKQLDNLITLHQRKQKCKFLSFPTSKAGLFLANSWEQREFNSIAKRITEMTDTEDLPRVEYEDIVSGQGTLNKDINKKKSCKTGILFDNGDVLFGKLRPYLKNWLFATFMGIAVGDFWVLRANNADGLYIYTLLQIDAFQDIANQSTGTKMPRADWSLVSKQRFLTPTVVPEQRKIGEFFKQLDNLITLHQCKDFALDTNKAFQQRCLLSIKSANAWEQRKLREVFDYERPDTYIVKSDKYSDTYSTPVLTANKGFILGYTNEMQVCNKECIIFDDFTLDSKYVTFPFMVKSSALKILTAKIGYFLPFAYQLLQATNIEILGHARHYISVVQPTKVLIPSNDEQIRIGKCIQQIDNLITLHQRKQTIKKRSKMDEKRRVNYLMIANAWEQRKLGGEAEELLAGGDIDKDLICESGRYPVIANALTNDGIVGFYEKYYRVEAPAVTVSGRGDVGHAQARRVNFTPVVRLLSIKSRHNVDFLENAINRGEVIIESTGVPQLTVPQLSKRTISFPQTVQEEEKIGKLFFKIDNLITLHQRGLIKIQGDKKWQKRKFQKNCSAIILNAG